VIRIIPLNAASLLATPHMPTPPIIHAEGLVFRPATLADADAIVPLANDRGVSDNLLTMPFPYTRADAIAWLEKSIKSNEEGKSTGFLITRPRRASGFAAESSDAEILGAVGCVFEPTHRRGEMGYWLGRPFWGKGYATIAARVLIRHIFSTTDLQRVHATHYIGNEASGRVMEKAGMRREGLLRGYTLKNGINRDVVMYAILRADMV